MNPESFMIAPADGLMVVQSEERNSKLHDSRR
jgi:hypothetical protein